MVFLQHDSPPRTGMDTTENNRGETKDARCKCVDVGI
jgi:hypothetical protein